MSSRIKELVPYMTNMVGTVAIARGMSEADEADLLGDVMLACIEADPTYDPERGLAYRNYMHTVAERVIRYALNERQNTVVPIPERLGRELSRARFVHTRLQQELGREPRNREVAEAMDITLEQYELMRTKSAVIPLPELPDDVPMYEDVAETPGPLDTLAGYETNATIQEYLEGLLPVETAVMYHLYGLGGEAEHSERDTATELGITRKMVRTYRDSAFRKLRARGLKFALGMTAGFDAPLNRFS